MKNIILLICCIFLVTGSVTGQLKFDNKLLSEMIELNKKNKTERLVISINDTIIADETFSGKPNDIYRIYSITKIF